MLENRINLSIGRAAIELILPNRALRDFLSEYFMGNLTDKTPGLSLKIEVLGGQVSYKMIPDSLFHAKRGSKGSFIMEGGIMEGHYSSIRRKGQVKIHPVLLETGAIRVFEQLLYQAYVTAAGSDYHLEPLIHSSGVIRDGKGYLFVGASEAGKSTVAGFSKPFQVINDEITIADISGDTPMLRSTPFNGFFRDKQSGDAPFKGIYILKKDKEHALYPARGGEAVKLIASQIIPPVGLDEYMQNHDYLRQVDIAVELSRRIPVYYLHFAKNAEFWDEISEGVV